MKVEIHDPAAQPEKTVWLALDPWFSRCYVDAVDTDGCLQPLLKIDDKGLRRLADRRNYGFPLNADRRLALALDELDDELMTW